MVILRIQGNLVVQYDYKDQILTVYGPSVYEQTLVIGSNNECYLLRETNDYGVPNVNTYFIKPEITRLEIEHQSNVFGYFPHLTSIFGQHTSFITLLPNSGKDLQSVELSYSTTLYAVGCVFEQRFFKADLSGSSKIIGPTILSDDAMLNLKDRTMVRHAERSGNFRQVGGSTNCRPMIKMRDDDRDM